MKSVVMRRQEMLISIPMLLALLLLISHCCASAHALEHQCMYDTEKIQTLINGPVVDVKTGLRHGFTPQGRGERTAPQKYRPVPPPDAPKEVHRAFQATAVDNIRFETSARDLETAGKFCAAADDEVPDFITNDKVKCTADDVLTDDKKEILLKNVLPAALNMLSSALKVKQVEGNLIAPGCERYEVPESHNVGGVANADYVLYVSAAPTTGTTVAWASHCSLDNDKRPVTGRANFAPKYLVWNDDDAIAQRKLVRTAVHELLHALGFSSSLWTDNFPNGNPIKEEKLRGKTVKYFSTEKVVEKAKTYFDCQTMKGPEMEDEGGINMVGSHWKRRNHKDDMMAGIMGDRMYLSPITLAVLEASGHYTIDWNEAEDPKWMYKAGCGVIDATCNTTAGGMDKYFCNDPLLVSCASDHRSIGHCGINKQFTDTLPEWAKYFPGHPHKRGKEPLMDYCPIIQGNKRAQCDNPANEQPNATNIPQYYANDGRCFESHGVKRAGYDRSGSSLTPASCLQTRCVSNAVEFKMPGNVRWIPCPSKGKKVTVHYGYDGYVICPDPDMICDGVEINVPTKTIKETPTGTVTIIVKKTPTGTVTTTTKETPGGTVTTTTTTNTSAGTTTEKPVTKGKSATAISSTIPALLISSVVFLYLSHLGH